MYAERGMEVIYLRELGERYIRSVPRLRRLLKSRQFDVIEIYGLRLNILGRLVARAYGQRVVVTAQRSVDDWRRWWHVWMDHYTSRWVTLYVANSQAAADRLTSRERIRPTKIRVIENGIDPAPFADAAKRVQARHAGTAVPVVITCVANLRPAKAHHVLVEAFSLVAKQHPDTRLRLVGDGISRTAIEQQITRLQLDSKVEVMGQRLDVPDILADSDVFVLSSLWEGMPGSLLEAMAAAMPVVATAVGGVPEVVVHEETGLLVEPNDPGQLAEAIARLIVDPRLRLMMGQRGLARVVSHFDLAAKVRDYDALYSSLASREYIP